jgi:anti-anti-sigma regulatory factor
MAKYRHRVFEMYELRDEAIRALTPRSGPGKTVTEATPTESWTFGHLEVTRAAGVICVQFKEPQTFEDGTASDLRDDLTQLADLLGRDSKVLFDFSGVTAFNAASISALVQFNRTLQTRGSRIALCCLESSTRDSFFVTG